MQEGIPYPHISLDDFLNDEAAELLLSSFEKLLEFQRTAYAKRVAQCEIPLSAYSRQGNFAKLMEPRE